MGPGGGCAVLCMLARDAMRACCAFYCACCACDAVRASCAFTVRAVRAVHAVRVCCASRLITGLFVWMYSPHGFCARRLLRINGDRLCAVRVRGAPAGTCRTEPAP